jgi:uncharacterized oligopeptide transporter (OPT) family protein
VAGSCEYGDEPSGSGATEFCLRVVVVAVVVVAVVVVVVVAMVGLVGGNSSSNSGGWICSFETLVSIYHTTLCNIPKNRHLHTCRHENIKCHILIHVSC